MIGYWPFGLGHGYWLCVLTIGYWPLVIVVGYWPLSIDYSYWLLIFTLKKCGYGYNLFWLLPIVHGYAYNPLASGVGY